MRFVNGARRGLLAMPLAIPLLMLTLCACKRYPESYAPPLQRPNFEDPECWERVIHMTDVDAPDHFIADIADPLAANWRWSGKRLMVHLDVPAQEGLAQAPLPQTQMQHTKLAYHIEFAIPQETFRSTGPVTLTFLLDGHALDVRRYDAAGPYQFEKYVPPEWISSGGNIRLGAEIDKVFSSQGRTYGFLLIAIGLKRN
jgi:hypothetical protein